MLISWLIVFQMCWTVEQDQNQSVRVSISVLQKRQVWMSGVEKDRCDLYAGSSAESLHSHKHSAFAHFSKSFPGPHQKSPKVPSPTMMSLKNILEFVRVWYVWDTWCEILLLTKSPTSKYWLKSVLEKLCFSIKWHQRGNPAIWTIPVSDTDYPSFPA